MHLIRYEIISIALAFAAKQVCRVAVLYNNQQPNGSSVGVENGKVGGNGK